MNKKIYYIVPKNHDHHHIIKLLEIFWEGLDGIEAHLDNFDNYSNILKNDKHYIFAIEKTIHSSAYYTPYKMNVEEHLKTRRKYSWSSIDYLDYKSSGYIAVKKDNITYEEAFEKIQEFIFNYNKILNTDYKKLTLYYLNKTKELQIESFYINDLDTNILQYSNVQDNRKLNLLEISEKYNFVSLSEVDIKQATLVNISHLTPELRKEFLNIAFGDKKLWPNWNQIEDYLNTGKFLTYKTIEFNSFLSLYIFVSIIVSLEKHRYFLPTNYAYQINQELEKLIVNLDLKTKENQDILINKFVEEEIEKLKALE